MVGELNRGSETQIKKDRSDQHSPRCPDHFGPSVSKLVSRVGKRDAKEKYLNIPL